MRKPRFGIVGGTHGIGRWFARYLTQQGYEVLVSGRSSGPDLVTLTRRCPVVVISVPIKATVEVIQQVGPLMPETSLLTDFTSLKEEPVKAMLHSARCEVIGLHPLFGPGVKQLNGQKVVICPARTRQWLPILTGILQKGGARLIETTPQQHDQWMALIQGLNHLNTLTLGLTLDRSGVELAELQSVSTPLFQRKMKILRRVFGPHPRLYAELLTENPYMKPVVENYLHCLRELGSLIRRRDNQGLEKSIQNTRLFVGRPRSGTGKTTGAGKSY